MLRRIGGWRAGYFKRAKASGRVSGGPTDHPTGRPIYRVLQDFDGGWYVLGYPVAVD